MHGKLVDVLVRRSRGNPGEFLEILAALADAMWPCARGSCNEGLADALSQMCLSESSAGMLLGGSCMKILYHPLVAVLARKS